MSRSSLRGFSTFRSQSRASGRARARTPSVADQRPRGGVPGSARCYALDPERDISQYLRDQWGSGQGFPGGPVHGITQGEDGYLWIATDRGLVRFDGLTFRLFAPLVTSADTGPTVLGVAPDPDGSVWARLKGPAVLRYRHREFEQAPVVEGSAPIGRHGDDPRRTTAPF